MEKAKIISITIFIVIFCLSFVSCHGKEKAFNYFEKGRQLYVDEKLDQALVYFLDSIKCNKNYKQSYVMAAKCYYLTGKNEESKKILQKALKKFDHYVDAEIFLGKVYYFEKNYAKARECFTNVLFEDSDHIDARFLLAELDKAEGKTEYAMTNYIMVVSYLDIIALSKIRTAEIFLKYNQVDKAIAEISFIDSVKQLLDQSTIAQANILLNQIKNQSYTKIP